MNGSDLKYAGFWIRVLAALIDTVLVGVVVFPLLLVVYGRSYSDLQRFIGGPGEILLSLVLAVAIVLFWLAKQATPGKMLVGAQIVDAKTGRKPSTSQLVGRYLGYYVSIIPLGLGLIWVAFDARKQGWHDKLAGTVVVRKTGSDAAPVADGGQEPGGPDA